MGVIVSAIVLTIVSGTTQLAMPENLTASVSKLNVRDARPPWISQSLWSKRLSLIFWPAEIAFQKRHTLLPSQLDPFPRNHPVAVVGKRHYRLALVG